MQAAFGATTVTCGPDSEKWLQQVPQTINHYFDQHVTWFCEEEVGGPPEEPGWGEWEVITVVSKCENHGLFLEDEYTKKWVVHYDHDGVSVGEDYQSIECKLREFTVSEIRKHCPFIPREFAATFDCSDMRAEWLEYLDNNILCDAKMFCTSAGAVRTNLVETVWHSFLKFRKKDSNIGGDKYCMLTNLAAAYFNQPYVQQWNPDYCMQARFAQLLRVPVPEETKMQWDEQNNKRMKDSIRRRTEKHKIKVAIQKKARRLRKLEDQRDAKLKKGETYKSGGHTFCKKKGGRGGVV